MVGIGRDLGFDARHDSGENELRLVTRAAPNLSEEGRDLAIIDRLLRNRRNAIRLPRAVTDADQRAPMRLVFETDEPEVVATRVFPQTPRSRARAIGPRQLELVVRPDGPGAAEPLSDRDRHRLTRATEQMPAAAPRLRDIVERVASSDRPVDQRASALAAWVHGHLRYQLTSEDLDALTILARRHGDCTEYARLTVTLLRAAGIPAEVRHGFYAADQEMVAHAWVAYHDGTRFREIDPTGRGVPVDSGHIPASVTGVVALLGLGQLSVTEIAPVEGGR
jgi:transglutaminase-like putative cysteine protease